MCARLDCRLNPYTKIFQKTSLLFFKMPVCAYDQFPLFCIPYKAYSRRQNSFLAFHSQPLLIYPETIMCTGKSSQYKYPCATIPYSHTSLHDFSPVSPLLAIIPNKESSCLPSPSPLHHIPIQAMTLLLKAKADPSWLLRDNSCFCYEFYVSRLKCKACSLSKCCHSRLCRIILNIYLRLLFYPSHATLPYPVPANR